MDEFSEQADSHEHFGHYHGNEDQETDGALEGKPVAVKHPGPYGAKQRRKNRRCRRDDKAVLECGNKDIVFEQRPIPLKRKPFPANVESRAVEGKDDEENDRDVEERKNECRPGTEEPALNLRAAILFQDRVPRRGAHSDNR